MNAEESPSGILLADKPSGLSSHDMVARARRAIGVRRVGHAGTLDPFATGLLIVLVGRATRLARFFVALPKTYEVVVRLGATSTTGDPEGEIVETGVVPETLVLPRGVLRQRPPAYSAVKVDGERAYARARRGEAVETAEREVTVHEATERWREGDRAGLRFVCSSGTYVRSLVADLGDAYCLELRRTAIGPFSVAGAWPGEGVAAVVAVAEAWARFGSVLALDEAQARAIGHGRGIPGRGVEGHALLVDASGTAVAVASEQAGELRIEVGLRG
ncbi:MAG TPA: tRNA pseudouridine(55) synthase TruB [Solirubrobacteraceae bacterium]|nr:tRNA pseudouridine(55) synthase TruB [Solirubrobacteraceae bacterium]